MLEKEKVMEGLKCCNFTNCGACPYAGMKRCMHILHEDAFVWLRAPEPPAVMANIEAILSIIRKKNSDLFNLQIKTLTDDDFPGWESAVHKMAHLRELETRLTLISVQIKSLGLEVEKIAEQTDQI